MSTKNVRQTPDWKRDTGFRTRAFLKLQALRLRRQVGRGLPLEKAIVICGAAGCGAPVVGRRVAEITDGLLVYEPFEPRYVSAARRAGIGSFPHLHVGDRWPKAEEYIRRCLAGRVLNDWTIQLAPHCHEAPWARAVVVSARATKSLAWIASQFPLGKPLLVTRHPCAVVAELVVTGQLPLTPRPDPRRIGQMFPHLESLLQSLDRPEQYAAASWSLDHLWALESPGGHFAVAAWEELSAQWNVALKQVIAECQWQSAETTQRLMQAARERRQQALRSKSDDALKDNKPRRSANQWRQILTPKQITDILEVTHAVGLDFYGETEQPNLDQLKSLVSQVSK